MGEAIHDTLNGLEDLDEKVVRSLGEAASKVIQSTGHAVKGSNMGIDNMFHGILGGIGGTIQWCLSLAIIVALLYINPSAILKLCKRKPSGLLNAPTTPLPTPSTDSDPTPNNSILHLHLNNPLSYLWSSPVLNYTIFLPHRTSLA